jgi:hypothetical protein
MKNIDGSKRENIDKGKKEEKKRGREEEKKRSSSAKTSARDIFALMSAIFSEYTSTSLRSACCCCSSSSKAAISKDIW